MIIVLINYIIISIMYSTRKTPKKKPVKKIIRRRRRKPKKPKTISKDIKQSVKQAVQVIIEAPKQKPRPKGLQPKATSIRDNITRPPLLQIIREERNNNTDFQIASLISTLQQQRQLTTPQPIPNINDNRLEMLEQQQQAQLLQQTELMRRQEEQVREQQQRDLDLQRQQQELRQEQQRLDQQQNERPRLTPTPTEVLNLLNRVEQQRRPAQQEEQDEFFDVEDLPTPIPIAEQIQRVEQPVEETQKLIPVISLPKPVFQPKKDFSDKPLNMFDEMRNNPIFLKQKEKEKGLNEKQKLDEKQAEEKSPSPPPEPTQAEEEPINIKFKMKKNATDVMTGKKIAGFNDKLEFIKKNNLKIEDKKGSLREVMFSNETPANKVKITKIFNYYGIDENTGNFISGEIV